MESITSDNRFVGKEKAYRWKQQISVKHVKEKKLYKLEKVSGLEIWSQCEG